MALARCEKCGKPEGRTKTYVRSVEPVGYPETAAICGISECENPALIWLNDEDDKLFITGQTIFKLPTYAIKIRVMNIQ